MNSAHPDTNERIAALEAELVNVKRREAEYRVAMIGEFLDRGERNSYLHTLHQERADLRARQQESFADLETLVRKLEAEGARRFAAEAELIQLRRTWFWRLTAPLRYLRAGVRTGAAPPSVEGVADYRPVEGGVFTYYLHTSPFRIYRERTFLLRGWAFPSDGRSVTAVRVNLGGRSFFGRYGLEEPEVIARYGPQTGNPRPGFEVTFETPPGQHALSLEAQLDGGEWRWIVQTSIWCEPKG